MKHSLLYSHVVIRTLALSSLRVCYAEYGKQMYLSACHTCSSLHFTANNILAFHSCCRSNSRRPYCDIVTVGQLVNHCSSVSQLSVKSNPDCFVIVFEKGSYWLPEIGPNHSSYQF